MPSLDLDYTFFDFNFCEAWDPTMAVGPDQAQLLKMVCDAREGNQRAASEFASAMYSTLRKAAFESFLRARGERAVFYHEWFYDKLSQFIEILLYEQICYAAKDGGTCWSDTWVDGGIVIRPGGPFLQPDEIDRLFTPEDNERLRWYDLVVTVSAAPQADRETALRAWVKQQRRAGSGPRNESIATAFRNNLIRNAGSSCSPCHIRGRIIPRGADREVFRQEATGTPGSRNWSAAIRTG